MKFVDGGLLAPPDVVDGVGVASVAICIPSVEVIGPHNGVDNELGGQVLASVAAQGSGNERNELSLKEQPHLHRQGGLYQHGDHNG